MDQPTLSRRIGLAARPGHPGWRMVACPLLAALLAWPLAGAAQGTAEAAEAPVVEPTPSNRHVELRRALVRDGDRAEPLQRRRRLTPEERIELHRNLRDAVRSAYEDRPLSRPD